AGSVRTVFWSHNYGASQLFDIDVSTDGGVTWTPGQRSVLASSATAGSADVRMPSVVTTQALVRVSPAGTPGDGDVSDVPFTLAAPTVHVSFPVAGTVWTIGATSSIDWGTNIGPGRLGYAAAISYDSGTTWNAITLDIIPTSNVPHGSWVVHGPATTQAR